MKETFLSSVLHAFIRESVVAAKRSGSRVEGAKDSLHRLPGSSALGAGVLTAQVQDRNSADSGVEWVILWYEFGYET